MTKALKNEVAGTAGTLEVVFGGLRFNIPADPLDFDIEVLEALTEGDYTAACRAVLGDAQWQQFKATKPKIRGVQQIFEKFAEVYGWGKSSASPASSPITDAS